MRSFAVAAIVVFTASAAHASGRIDCRIEDKSLSAEMNAIVSDGLAGQVTNPAGEVKIKAKAVPGGLARVEVGSDHLAHSWVYDREMRLHWYRETDAGTLELVIRTKAPTADATGYAGTYEAKIDWPLPGKEDRGSAVFKGRVACSVG